MCYKNSMLALVMVLAAPPAAAERFLADLQHALARQDKPAVAALFEYPAMVLASGLRMPVADRATLVKMYDIVFPPALQGVVAMARVARAGQPAPVYGVALNDDSLVVGLSWIFARRANGRYRITRVVPPGGMAMPLRRITFKAGQASALFSGTLIPYEMQSYIIAAAKGQRLQVKLDGFSERAAVARLIETKSGLPLDDTAGDGTRQWSGTIADNIDVRIDVLRLAAADRPAPTYILSVGLR